MRHFLLLFYLLHFSLIACAQSAEIPVPIPPAPNAASLGQYVDVPVSTYTGVPEINIPLVEIRNNDLVHTIAASYHASGIKVSQEASLIGLGWAIQMGGVISRTIKGKDDIKAKGFMYTEDPPNSRTSGNWAYNDQESTTYFNFAASTGVDTDPDFFFYNFGRYSGKLLIKNCATCTVFQGIPEKPNGLKFTYNSSSKVWKVLDGDGIEYSFEELEYSINFITTENSPISSNFDPIGQRPYTPDDEHISSWYLTSITSPKGHTITFSYKSEGYLSQTVPARFHSVQKSVGYLGPNDVHTYSISAQVIRNVYLEEIDFESGRVELITADRSDILVYSYRPFGNSEPVYNPQRLSAIKVYYNNGTTADKTITFDNDQYFGESYSQNPQLYYRLKLDNIQVSDRNGISTPPYNFSYHIPSTVPPKNSFSIDHWGYFNNAPNNNVPSDYFTLSNETLIPTTIVNTWTGQIVARGANRKSDEEHTKIFVLESITYPTGGTHTFEYELNTFNTAPADYYISDEDPGSIQVLQQVNTSNVFMEECPYNDDITGVQTLEFLIDDYTIGNFYGQAINECVYCSEDPYGTPFYYIGDPNNPQNHVFMNIESYDGQVMAKLEAISGPGGSVVSFIENVHFYYNEPGTTNSYQHTSIVQGCAQGDFLSASERHNDIPLFSGWYRLTVYPIAGMITDSYLAYSQDNEIEPIDPQKTGAGLRVKKITISDGEEPIVKSYEYSYGELMTIPRYSTEMPTNEMYWFYPFEPDMGCENTTLLLASEGSIVPIGTSAQGGFVGYSSVKEYSGPNENETNGYTLFSYRNRPEEPVHTPIAPGVAGEYFLDNGLIHAIIYYDKNDSIVKRVYYDYELDTGASPSIIGAHPFFVNGETCYPVAFAYYDYTPQWWKQTQMRTVEHTPEGMLETITNYTAYNPVNKKVETMELVNSDEKASKTVFQYPVSSVFEGNQDLGNHLLKNKHIHDVVLREISSVDNNVVYKRETSFESNNGNVVPAETRTYPQGTVAVAEVYEHNSDGKIIEVQKEQGPPVSYLWGYAGQYPVAEARNASASEIAYTSFESDGKGNWTYSGTISTNASYALTGRKYYAISGGMSRSGLTGAQPYILSYWQKGGTVNVTGGTVGPAVSGRNYNGWTYVERRISGATTVSLSGSGYIDEVRLYPTDAQMDTYTFDPLIGMTSHTDAASNILYYEYDALQRLKAIRDQNGKLVEEYRYHYHNQ